MNNLEKADNMKDIANFLGKVLNGIATGRAFTKQDAKDAVDAVNAVVKLATEEHKDATGFFNLLADATKGGMDLIEPDEGREER